MSTQKIKAGEAFVRATVQNDMGQGLDDATKQVEKWKSGLAGVGVSIMAGGAAITAAGLAMLGPLAVAVGHVDELGSALVDMSSRTGVAIESLAALRYVAEQSDVAFESLTGAFKNMQKTLTDRAGQDALEDLGLSAETLLQLPGENQLFVIADAIAGIADPAQRSAAAMKVFGKSGMDLLPLLSLGSSGIHTLMEEAESLGLVMDTQTALSAEAWGDAWGAIKSQLKMVSAEVGAALLPALQQLSVTISGVLSGVIDWIRQNDQVVVMFAATGVALVAFGQVVTVVGAKIAALGIVLKLLASPVTLGVLAVAALGAALITVVDGWDEVANVMSAAYMPVAREVLTIAGDIKDALSIGDTAAAWELFTLNMKAFWQGFVSTWGEGVRVMTGWLDELIQKVTFGLLDLENLMGKGWLPDAVGADQFLEKFDAWNAARLKMFNDTERQIRDIRDRTHAEIARRDAEAAASQPKGPDLIGYLDGPLELFGPPKDWNAKFMDDTRNSKLAQAVQDGAEVAFESVSTSSAAAASRISGVDVDWQRRAAVTAEKSFDVLREMNDNIARWGHAVFA